MENSEDMVGETNVAVISGRLDRAGSAGFYQVESERSPQAQI